jgi:mannan endo-1,4-beta-mannosidase
VTTMTAITTLRTIFLSAGPAWLFVKAVTVTFGLIALSRLLPGRNRQVPQYRPHHGTTLAVILFVAALGAVAGVGVTRYDAVRETSMHATEAATLPQAPTLRAVRPAPASLPVTTTPYFGVFENGEESSWASVSTFGTAVGRQPDIVLCFEGWQAGFPLQFAEEASSHRAVLLIQLTPKNISLAAIAQGSYDPYLESYAEQARAYGGQVIISFAPEMNGNWYSWGWTNSSPASYVAAWRHVVTVFRNEGASNVIWLWTVNRISQYTGPISDYWPGDDYVTWVGYDDYIYLPSETFASVDEPTIEAIRTLTTKPIMLSETAVGQVAGPGSIPGLVAGVAQYHLLGLVWFDENQSGDVFHQQWRVEDNPAAVAALREAVATYMP